MQLRKDGVSLAEIARRLGISRSRVTEVYWRAKHEAWCDAQPADSIAHLSARAWNGLRNAGLPMDATAVDVIMQLGRLRRGVYFKSPENVRNFGKVSLAEVEAWLTHFV